MRKKNKPNKPNKLNQLARSGNPAKRAEVTQEEKKDRAKAKAKDRFMRITGLVVVGVLAATLLVGVFSDLGY